jgi:hypothetical protein
MDCRPLSVITRYFQRAVPQESYGQSPYSSTLTHELAHHIIVRAIPRPCMQLDTRVQRRPRHIDVITYDKLLCSSNLTPFTFTREVVDDTFRLPLPEWYSTLCVTSSYLTPSLCLSSLTLAR